MKERKETLFKDIDTKLMEQFFVTEMHDVSDTTIWYLDENGERNVFEGFIQSVDLSNDSITYFVPDLDRLIDCDFIYFNMPDKNIIYKSARLSLVNKLLTTNFPQEVKFLDQPFWVDKMDREMLRTMPVDQLKTKLVGRTQTELKDLESQISLDKLDEEDKVFADLREAPRARPKVDKMVTIERDTDFGVISETYVLYDLSKGGMGFLVYDQKEFSVGENIRVVSFDAQSVGESMVGIVRAVRDADDLGVQYKVGVQFIDE